MNELLISRPLNRSLALYIVKLCWLAFKSLQRAYFYVAPSSVRSLDLCEKKNIIIVFIDHKAYSITKQYPRCIRLFNS